MNGHDQDIRWRQRLNNYTLALQRLGDAVDLAGVRSLSPLEQQGLIQAFEFTHELAWNVMKDYFFWQGNSAITGSRDATREAYAKGLLDDGEAWMAMIKSRNLSSHTYNQNVADAIADAVVSQYYPLMRVFEQRMRDLEANGV
ncbi:MAG: nucleotidyltransferase substrate binding protein [Azonexus sp.]